MQSGKDRRVVRIPEGLTELLQDFTVAVLREQPDDLFDFSFEYFKRIKRQKSGGGVGFDAKVR